MDCAEIVEAFKPLRVTSQPVPEVPDDGLLLKTLYAGICHSDLHILDDETDLGDGKVFRHRDALGEEAYKGLILGHEICGEIIGVGSKVPSGRCSLQLGDVVIIYPWVGCRSCEACSLGYSNLCENNRGGTTDVGQGGSPGGYASIVAVPEWDLAIKLPRNIPPKIGCMLPCSVLTAYGAMLKARPHLEQAVRMRGVANLLLIGAGGLGFWNIVLVKSIFCDKNVKVIVADVHEEKLREATRLGADDAVLWPEDADLQALVDNTTVSGYNKMDAAVDYVGLARTSRAAVGCLHNGGALVCVGLRGGQLALSIPTAISRTLSVHGVRIAPIQTLREVVDLFAVQDVEQSCLPPVEEVRLQDINEAHAKLRRGQIMARAVIKYVT